MRLLWPFSVNVQELRDTLKCEVFSFFHFLGIGCGGLSKLNSDGIFMLNSKL